MSDGDALLKAILANPADDTVRLVYADWLDENGRPVDAALQRVLARPDDDSRRLEYAAAAGGERGEFVRVQVEIARRVRCNEVNLGGVDAGCPCDRCASYQTLRARERELLTVAAKRHWEWAGPDMTFWLKGHPRNLPPGRPDRLVGLFRRGFVEEVSGPAADWFSHGDQIRAAHPVARVRLTTWPTQNELACCFPRVGEMVPVHLRDIPRPERVANFLAQCWPGVEFEPPPAPTTQEQFDAITGNLLASAYQDMYEGMLIQVAQSLGVPTHVIAPPPAEPPA